MNKDAILQADVLDIVFDNRNKHYGAYHLRKFYQQRLVKAILITTGSVTILSAFTLIPAKEKNKLEEEVIVINLPHGPTAKPKEPVQKAAPSKPANTFKLTSQLRIVQNEKDSVDVIINATDQMQVGVQNNLLVEGTPGILIGDPGPGSGGEGPAEPTFVEPIPDPTIPVDHPDVEPSFPGGMEALRAFLQRNLVTPEEVGAGETIAVQVRFVVGYDGKLKDLKVVKDGGTAFNKEVLRVVKKMPDWTPGKDNGKNVSVYFTLPVKFEGIE